MAQATSNENKADRAGNRPAHTIRYSGIRAAIWRNVMDNGNASRAHYCVTFSRLYRDGQKNWKESSSFAADDLLVLAKIANEAHTYIYQHRGSGTNSVNHPPLSPK